MSKRNQLKNTQSHNQHNKHNKKPIPKKHGTDSYLPNKQLPKEKSKPLTQGWKFYYLAAKQLKVDITSALRQYENAHNFAKLNNDVLLQAACCQEQAHLYYNIGVSTFEEVNCMELFAHNKNITYIKDRAINPQDAAALGNHFFKKCDQRFEQISSLIVTYGHLDNALNKIKEAKKAIINFRPADPQEKDIYDQIKKGIEINVDILKTARNIVADLNLLFSALTTHRKHVKAFLGAEWKKKDPTSQKSLKTVIYHELSEAIGWYDKLLNKHDQIIPGSEQIQL